MKSMVIVVMLASWLGTAEAEGVEVPQISNQLEVQRMLFGAGTPAIGAPTGTESADHVADGVYHVPNYLPGYPTAGTIWPREISVECRQDMDTGRLVCDGYRIHPTTGRGEYIFIRPVTKMTPPVPALQSEESKDRCQCSSRDEALKPLQVTHKKPLG